MFHTLTELRKQKEIVKKEISEVEKKSNNAAERKKMLKCLLEKLKLAKEKVNKANFIKEERLRIISEKIVKEKEVEENLEKKIIQILEKYGNPSINSTCLL
jgi:hypothetical protein